LLSLLIEGSLVGEGVGALLGRRVGSVVSAVIDRSMRQRYNVAYTVVRTNLPVEGKREGLYVGALEGFGVAKRERYAHYVKVV